jgi:tRNA A-37 threonylcarbamoyl transferase component Bud32
VLRVYAISIGLGLVAGVSWALSSTVHPHIEPGIDPNVARELVAADAGSHWSVVEARAAQLAALPQVAAAVATDATTVRDLSASGELPLGGSPREAVELGQIHGERAVSLLRAPESAPPVPLSRPGRWLSVTGRELRFTSIASVVPVQDAERMRGAVAVSTAAPPDVALQKLAARTPGRLVVNGAPVDIAGGIPAGGATIEVSLDELPGAPRLILPADASVPPLAHALRAFAIASLLGGVGAALALAARARRPRAPARGLAVAAPASGPVLAAPASVAPAAPAAPAAPSLRMDAATVAYGQASGSPDAATVAYGQASGGPDAATVAYGHSAGGLDAATVAYGHSAAGPNAATVAYGHSPAASAAAAADAPSTAKIAAPGTARLGPYEPLALLGRGGTSSVYLARATGGAAAVPFVALKVLRSHLAHDERQRTIFLDEARVVSCIDHANVIRVFDLGYAEDQIYIAMEHVDGEDLESLLRRVRAEERHVPVPVAVAILERICAGLHAAHTATDRNGRALRVVHRDVKPGNVLASRAGSIKVSDFGIAKARQQVHTSLLGEARGTTAFMAPEQRLGQLVDARADVFGVAAIAYELLTSLEIDLDLARLAQYGTRGWPHLPPIRNARPDVPPALEQLLFRGLAYAAADRPSSCAELRAELVRIAAESGWAAGDAEVAAWVQAELARGPRRSSGIQGPIRRSGPQRSGPQGSGPQGSGPQGSGAEGAGSHAGSQGSEAEDSMTQSSMTQGSGSQRS